MPAGTDDVMKAHVVWNRLRQFLCFPACKHGAEFECANGKCIPLAWECDFEDDCGDASDESNFDCTDVKICGLHERNCSSDLGCFSMTQWCDHFTDCPNNADEKCAGQSTTAHGYVSDTDVSSSSVCDFPVQVPQWKLCLREPCLQRCWRLRRQKRRAFASVPAHSRLQSPLKESGQWIKTHFYAFKRF